MVLGIGIDITSMDRVTQTLARSGDIFLHRIFSDNEQRRGNNYSDGLLYYATGFALKEAVFKAFNTVWQNEMSMRDIEVIFDDDQYQILLHREFLQMFHEKHATSLVVTRSLFQRHIVALAILQ